MLCFLFSGLMLAPGAASGPRAAATAQNAKITLEEGEGLLSLRFGSQRFADVHYAETPVPYIWPLYAPGEVPVTRSWPMAEGAGEEHDHPHHRSLWIAHGDVNGVDFWHAGAARPGRIEFTGNLLERIARGKRFLIGLEYAWKSPEGETLLVERRRMLFGAEDDQRWIDFELLFHTPLEEVTFGDTKEGFFALRLHPELRLVGQVAKGSARNSEGLEGAAVWGKRADWVHYQGTVDGHAVGVQVLDHPDNPRHPTWWHARDYGLVAANPFGQHDFEGGEPGAGKLVLKKGESLTFRYRVWIHPGAKSAGELAAELGVFVEQTKR